MLTIFDVPTMFKFILLSISESWIDIGLDSPAKCIKYFGFVFFKYFLIELIFKNI